MFSFGCVRMSTTRKWSDENLTNNWPIRSRFTNKVVAYSILQQIIGQQKSDALDCVQRVRIYLQWKYIILVTLNDDVQILKMAIRMNFVR